MKTSNSDRAYRSLIALDQSASSARVLNLRAVHLRRLASGANEHSSFFTCPLLNRSIVVKHRLRQDEYSLFDRPIPVATKVLIPIDHENLRAGAHSVFVGQKNFDLAMAETFGDELRVSKRDRVILNIIDGLPSLDPFLLRESLKAQKIDVPQEYFAISDADIRRMQAFTANQLRAIASLSARSELDAITQTDRLVEKLLSSDAENEFGPLRLTLQLQEDEFSRGLFAWRGFLYYKWVLFELKMPVLHVAEQIGLVCPAGPMENQVAEYLSGAKQRIRAKIARGLKQAMALLGNYDRAYAQLTEGQNPLAFREFILTAPGLFAQLGDVLGALQHIVSFWSYRFPSNKPALIAPVELMDLFLDFEGSLQDPEEAANSARQAAQNGHRYI
jgi:hypothetical protein